MKELQPVNQNVVLDITDRLSEQKTSGGIIIPDTAREKPRFARIVAMSNVENTDVSIGDVVLLKQFSGNEVQHEGEKYLILPYADILAKLVDTEAI